MYGIRHDYRVRGKEPDIISFAQGKISNLAEVLGADTMTNAEIAAVFTEIAEMLRIKKDNIFKIRAYEKVARAIMELSEPVDKLVSEERISEIDGAGPAITKKITELVTTGRLEYYEKLKAEFPKRANPART